ncbi:hypothetical protein Elgi_63360 [Paenibacillus elgii]|nr:hypothetical protein Elgi_63360 [Paenibacillus elgii]
MTGPTTIKTAINDCDIAMTPCSCFSGTCCLNSFITDGWENWESTAKIKVVKSSAYQEPECTTSSTTKAETADKRLHQTIVRFGSHRSANIPPIVENKKIGA